MSTLLVYLVIAVLVAGAFALLMRSLRPTDERVTAFGSLITTSLRATKAPAGRAVWRLDDHERGLRASFDLSAHDVTIELRPLGDLAEPDVETAAQACWIRETEDGAPWELFEQEGYPTSTQLVQLGPALESLRSFPIHNVNVLWPLLDTSVDTSPDGAEAARLAVQAYPAVRDLYVRLREAGLVASSG